MAWKTDLIKQFGPCFVSQSADSGRFSLVIMCHWGTRRGWIKHLWECLKLASITANQISTSFLNIKARSTKMCWHFHNTRDTRQSADKMKLISGGSPNNASNINNMPILIVQYQRLVAEEQLEIYSAICSSSNSKPLNSWTFCKQDFGLSAEKRKKKKHAAFVCACLIDGNRLFWLSLALPLLISCAI